MVDIILFEDQYAGDFKRLNLEWLDRYQLTESHDLAVLEDPRGTIIDRGGEIYLAREGDQIIGTAALVKTEEGIYELAKMAVAPEHRGRNISKLLLETCLDRARALKAKKIELFSNHLLETALKLYESYGFNYVSVTNSPFETADIKMEKLL